MRSLLFPAILCLAAACGPKSAAPEEAAEPDAVEVQPTSDEGAEADVQVPEEGDGGPWVPMSGPELEACAAVIDAAFEGATPTMNPGARGGVQEAHEAQMDAVRRSAQADEELMSCCERTAGHFSVIANPTLANNWMAKDTCCDLIGEGAPPVCER